MTAVRERQDKTGEKSPAISLAVVVPCYRETRHILGVLAAIPDSVAAIYCVDDGCPDGTGALVEEQCADGRVRVLRHEKNQGVGAAVLTGYRQAMADGAMIVVKLDGDGQMDPRQVPRLVRPIAEGRADYAKGNRFYSLDSLAQMPRHRILGNAVLSFLNKLSTGYWRIFDPTNGFTAIHARILTLLPLDRIAKGYFFETDMLFRLSTVRAVVVDVPQSANYGEETSHLKPHVEAPRLLFGHCRNFLHRIFYSYFLRDFHIASLFWILGPLLFLFGLVFGIYEWVHSVRAGVAATAGTVMLSALTFLVGLQMLLSALHFDIENQPATPLHPLLDDGDD